MKVQEVMTSEVRTCRPETNLADAAMQMWKGDFGVLPVVSGSGKPIGMITDRDICMAAATKRREIAAIRVREVISGKVYACSRDADIHRALGVMRAKRVRRLPVIDPESGQLAGVLSLNDLALKAQLGVTADLTIYDVAETLKAICAHPTLPQKETMREVQPSARLQLTET